MRAIVVVRNQREVVTGYHSGVPARPASRCLVYRLIRPSAQPRGAVVPVGGAAASAWRFRIIWSPPMNCAAY